MRHISRPFFSLQHLIMTHEQFVLMIIVVMQVQARQGRHSIAYTPRCDTENLMSLLVSLQIVDPENIVKLAYKGNLGSFCKRV